jgi:magnesium transporter
VIRIHAYGGAGVKRHERLDEVPALLAAGEKVWIDVTAEDGVVTAFLTDVLKLHPLAVEDILQDRPSPKVEDYGDYLYIVAHGVVPDAKDPTSAETIEVDLVLSEQWLFTHHTGVCSAVDVVMAELLRNPKALERGPAFMAHAVLDHLVDGYLPVVDRVDDAIDELEHDVVEHPSKEVLQRIFGMKRSLQRLRRVALHQREVLQRLARGEFEIIPEKALPFYRDVHDHFVRVADLADSYREMLSGALEAYLSTVSNRMNEVMKTLTIVATLMLPITFIAGLYGMNFQHMPELAWRGGYPFALGLMGLVTIGMLFWFRHKRWL